MFGRNKAQRAQAARVAEIIATIKDRPVATHRDSSRAAYSFNAPAFPKENGAHVTSAGGWSKS